MAEKDGLEILGYYCANDQLQKQDLQPIHRRMFICEKEELQHCEHGGSSYSSLSGGAFADKDHIMAVKLHALLSSCRHVKRVGMKIEVRGAFSVRLECGG